jgi:hypothetical protein
MNLRESEKKLYDEALERLTKSTRPLGQKYVDHMKQSLDAHFAFRASLHPSEIDGENLNLRWRSRLRRWFGQTIGYFQAVRRIKKRNSFKLDA